MDESGRLSEDEIAERATRLKNVIVNLHVEDAARVLTAARMVRADDGDMKSLAKFRLQEALSEPKPDPRYVHQARLFDQEESGQRFISGMNINIESYRVKDASLSRIIAECDEKVLAEMTTAYIARAKKLKPASPAMPVMRELWQALADIFKSRSKR